MLSSGSDSLLWNRGGRCRTRWRGGSVRGRLRRAYRLALLPSGVEAVGTAASQISVRSSNRGPRDGTDAGGREIEAVASRYVSALKPIAGHRVWAAANVVSDVGIARRAAEHHVRTL